MFIYSFIHSSILSFINTFICLFIYLFVCLCIYIFIYWLIYPWSNSKFIYLFRQIFTQIHPLLKFNYLPSSTGVTDYHYVYFLIILWKIFFMLWINREKIRTIVDVICKIQTFLSYVILLSSFPLSSSSSFRFLFYTTLFYSYLLCLLLFCFSIFFLSHSLFKFS